MALQIQIGTAGWSIGSAFREDFPGGGSHLERYACRLPAVEINSSFYREHKPETYAKWAKAVPENFRFSVKLNRYFSQEMRLQETGTRLREVLRQSLALGEKWGALLIQLPPSLEFNPHDTERFILSVQKEVEVPMVWEPRHSSWKSLRAIEIFSHHGVSKVLADPERVMIPRRVRTEAQSSIYVRLHGSPVIYRSEYTKAFIQNLAVRLQECASRRKPSWCIFDNTTLGHATKNALDLAKLIGARN